MAATRRKDSKEGKIRELKIEVNARPWEVPKNLRLRKILALNAPEPSVVAETSVETLFFTLFFLCPICFDNNTPEVPIADALWNLFCQIKMSRFGLRVISSDDTGVENIHN